MARGIRNLLESLEGAKLKIEPDGIGYFKISVDRRYIYRYKNKSKRTALRFGFKGDSIHVTNVVLTKKRCGGMSEVLREIIHCANLVGAEYILFKCVSTHEMESFCIKNNFRKIGSGKYNDWVLDIKK